MSDFQLDILKLLAPLVVACGIAFWTVRMALSRFKREKAWERRMALYSDCLVALFEMSDCATAWLEEAEGERVISSEEEDRFIERNRAARRQFNHIQASAALLLPHPSVLTLRRVEEDIALVERELGGAQAQDEKLRILAPAIEEISTQGRQVLETDTLYLPLWRKVHGWLGRKNQTRLSYADEKQQ